LIEYLKESEIMFKSEVTLLKNENAKQSESLGGNARSTINNIMKSMSIFRINSYDAQVIHRDLIGMAQESELRGSSLEHDISNDLKEFVNEIVNNSTGPSIIEILLGFLIKLSSIFFLSFGFLSVGAYSSLSWNANSIIFLLYFGMTFISFIADGLITPLYSVKKGFKKYVPTIISMTLFFMLTAIVFMLNDNSDTIKIYAGSVIMLSGLGYCILSYLNVKNINRLSTGKRNYIADLINK